MWGGKSLAIPAHRGHSDTPQLRRHPQRPAHTGPHRPMAVQSPWAALGMQTEQPHLHTQPAPMSTPSPRSLCPPAMAGSLSLSVAIHLATPSSSPSNQFRQVLGLRRRTIPAYAPSLPRSLLQAAPCSPAGGRGGERGRRAVGGEE